MNVPVFGGFNNRAKARIMVLDNHEDREWSKNDTYAPVLRPDTMRLIVSMAVEQHRTLRQGDCKNAFCQGIFPPDEITIVKPPIGNQDTKKDKYWLLKRPLYGLCWSPRDIGMSRLNPSLRRLGFVKTHTIRASSVVISSTPPILWIVLWATFLPGQQGLHFDTKPCSFGTTQTVTSS